ncbi:MAG: hypothetical protein NVS2B9_11280 [Myxococcales bacterium]
MNSLGVAWLPGVVFLLLAVWLVRKAFKAARTERDLEEERLAAALGSDLLALRAGAAPPQAASRPRLATLPGGGRTPASTAGDAAGCTPGHLALIEELRAGRSQPGGTAAAEVIWARSAGEHAAWCERRAGGGTARDVLFVIQVRDGKIVGRWAYGDG